MHPALSRDIRSKSRLLHSWHSRYACIHVRARAYVHAHRYRHGAFVKLSVQERGFAHVLMDDVCSRVSSTSICQKVCCHSCMFSVLLLFLPCLSTTSSCMPVARRHHATNAFLWRRYQCLCEVGRRNSNRARDKVWVFVF